MFDWLAQRGAEPLGNVTVRWGGRISGSEHEQRSYASPWSGHMKRLPEGQCPVRQPPNPAIVKAGLSALLAFQLSRSDRFSRSPL